MQKGTEHKTAGIIAENRRQRIRKKLLSYLFILNAETPFRSAHLNTGGLLLSFGRKRDNHAE